MSLVRTHWDRTCQRLLALSEWKFQSSQPSLMTLIGFLRYSDWFDVAIYTSPGSQEVLLFWPLQVHEPVQFMVHCSQRPVSDNSMIKHEHCQESDKILWVPAAYQIGSWQTTCKFQLFVLSYLNDITLESKTGKECVELIVGISDKGLSQTAFRAAIQTHLIGHSATLRMN